jgi:hypothetical protein
VKFFHQVLKNGFLAKQGYGRKFDFEEGLPAGGLIGDILSNSKPLLSFTDASLHPFLDKPQAPGLMPQSLKQGSTW